MRFQGRVVIVTGAGRGIGAAVARAFGREGARLALLDIDAPGVQALADDLATQSAAALALKTDVTASADVQAAVDTVLARWGRVDVLVNNAGGFARIRKTEEIPEDEWDAVLRLNVTSAFLCAKAVLPVMKRQRAGRIINLSSTVARGNAVTATSHYVAAKAAVVGFTRHLAREVALDGITVNAVAPGTVATERFRALRSEAETRRLTEAVPLGRVAEPEEIADGILFLASDAARYITGATLDINGGITMV